MRGGIICTLLAASTLFDTAFSFSTQLAFTNTNSPHSFSFISNDVPAPKPSRVQTSVPSLSHRTRRQPTAVFAIPDISSFATNPSSDYIPNNSAGIFSPQTLAASASATLTYISLLAYFDRPRGSLDIPDPQSTLVVQQSRVPGAGLGLFATTYIPRGTVLGTYPGVLRPAEAFYNGKCRQYPQAVGYSWRFTDSKFVIDPTDSQGEIQGFCLGGSSVPLSNAVFGTLLQFLRVDTMLCRINEPPIGAGGCCHTHI
ncbi:hypothetical protein ACHAXR_000692 [Thalassiosira sp. AJA248-18]